MTLAPAMQAACGAFDAARAYDGRRDAREKQRLVADIRCGVRRRIDAQRLHVSSVPPAVAAAQKNGRFSLRNQQFGDSDRGRRLARPAGNEIANADD